MPYTYLVINKTTGIAYYGLRFAKNANPDLFWKKDPYRTSSKIIHQLIKTFGENDFYTEIRKVFSSKLDAIEWESKVNRRLTVKSSKFCNMDSCQMPHMAIQNLIPTRRISNPDGKLCLTVPKNMILPLGWVEGNINLKNKTKLKTFWFYNPETNDAKMFQPGLEPNGWISGRGPGYKTNAETLTGKSIWITDGNNTVYHPISDPIPDGWKRGRTKSDSERVNNLLSIERRKNNEFMINNGIVNKLHNKSEPIPEDWVKGKLISDEHRNMIIARNTNNKGNTFWAYHVGTHKNKLFRHGESIPMDYKKGFFR